MTRRTLALIPVIALALVGSVAGAISISVTPPILDISIPPGGRKVFPLTVRNVGDVRVSVKPAVMDLTLSVTGSAVPVEKGSTKWSCADWVSLDMKGFSLGPGEGDQRDLVVNVPMGVSGGRYCVVLFEASPVDTRVGQSHLLVSTRTGTVVMETIPGMSARSGNLTGVTVLRASRDTMAITAYFENQGDIHVTMKPGCIIRSLEGRIIDRVKMDAGTGTVLPGSKRQITGAWTNKRKMAPGRYVAEVTVDYRGRKRATASAEFSIE